MLGLPGQLPVSVLAIALSTFVVRDIVRHRAHIDLAGTFTFTAAAALITFGLIRAAEDGWACPAPTLTAAAGLVFLAVFAFLQVRTDHPLIDLRLLRHPGFTGAALAAGVFSCAAFGSSALLSIWLQSVVGLTPLQAGMTLLLLSATAFLTAGLLGRRVQTAPVARTVGGGLFLIGCSVLLMLGCGAGSSCPALVPGLVVLSFEAGWANPPLTATALAAVPVHRSGTASGVLNTARPLGQALGIAVLGSVSTTRAVESLQNDHVPAAADTVSVISAGQTATMLAVPPSGAREFLRTAVHEDFAHGLHGVFIAAGAVGLIGSAVVFALLSRVPVAVGGRATAVPIPEQPSTAAVPSAPSRT